MFSGNPDQTPRYEYNQIMYRLDLSDLVVDEPPEQFGIVRRKGSLVSIVIRSWSGVEFGVRRMISNMVTTPLLRAA